MMTKTYLIPSFKVNKAQSDFLHAISVQFSFTSPELRGFQQVFAYGFCAAEDSLGFCPLSRDFRRTHLGGEDLLRLCDPKLGPLILWEHSRATHRCRLYRVIPWILQKFKSLSCADSEVIDWISGSAPPGPLRTPTYTSTRKPLPSLVSNAINVHNCVPKLFHPGRVAEAIVSLEKGPFASPSEQLRAAIRADQGRRFLHNVPLQEVRDIMALPYDLRTLVKDEGFTAYLPLYSLKDSGRLYETHGGCQNLPKELKRAAFNHSSLHNYDIRACHPSILRQLLEDYNAAAGSDTLDDGWLKDYLDNPSRRDELAAKVGISISCWKRCVLALFYGAMVKIRGRANALQWQREEKSSRTTPHSSGAGNHGSQSYSIFDAIWHDLAHETPGCDEHYQATVDRVRLLKDCLGGFDSVMRQLAQFLADPKMGTRNFSPLFKVNKCGSRLTNLCGLKMDLPRISDGKLDDRLSGKHLLCHILQGAEAAFIHRIVAIHEDYSYLPLGNEHDGVITFGTIPPVAIERVRNELGLRHVFLELKPF